MSKTVIDHVDYDYPQCGGARMTLADDGDTLTVEYYSNMQGQHTGSTEVYTGYRAMLERAGKDGLDASWNDNFTYREMLMQYEFERLGLSLVRRTDGHLVE